MKEGYKSKQQTILG